MNEPVPASELSLAAKLDRLFQVMHRRGGKEHSYEEVAEAIRQGGGPTISATYIWQLRKGIRDNPTKRHLEALASFFGVPPAYFLDDAAAREIDEDLTLLRALRDASVRQIAFRANDLSQGSLRAIAEMVETARKLEGLPDTTAEEP